MLALWVFDQTRPGGCATIRDRDPHRRYQVISTANQAPRPQAENLTALQASRQSILPANPTW